MLPTPSCTTPPQPAAHAQPLPYPNLASHAGITAPQEYGGLGFGYSEHCIAMEVGRRGRAHGGHSRRPLHSRTPALAAHAPPSSNSAGPQSSHMMHPAPATRRRSPPSPSSGGQPPLRRNRAVVRRAQQPVRQPAGAQWQRGAEATVPAAAHIRCGLGQRGRWVGGSYVVRLPARAAATAHAA